MAETLYALTASQVERINRGLALLEVLAAKLPGLGPISVSVVQRVFVTSRVKNGDYYDAVVRATEEDSTGEAVLLSYSGPLPANLDEGILAIRTGTNNGRVFFTGPYNPANTLFPAQLLERRGSGPYTYAWEEWRYTDNFGVEVKPGGRTGKSAANGTLVHTRIAGGGFSDKWTLTIAGAEDGTYSVVFDGGSPAISAFNIAPTVAGATITPISDGVWTIEPGDTSGHTLTLDDSGLKPTQPSNPAITVSSGALKAPAMVHLMEAGGGPAICEIKEVQRGDPKANPPLGEVLSLQIRNVKDGAYKIKLRDATSFEDLPPTDWIAWNADAGTIQGALAGILTCEVSGGGGNYILAVKADNRPYSGTTDMTRLRNTQSYVVVSGFGDACTGPFGGIDPATIEGYDSTKTRQYPVLESGCIKLVTPGVC